MLGQLASFLIYNVLPLGIDYVAQSFFNGDKAKAEKFYQHARDLQADEMAGEASDSVKAKELHSMLKDFGTNLQAKLKAGKEAMGNAVDSLRAQKDSVLAAGSQFASASLAAQKESSLAARAAGLAEGAAAGKMGWLGKAGLIGTGLGLGVMFGRSARSDDEDDIAQGQRMIPPELLARLQGGAVGPQGDPSGGIRNQLLAAKLQEMMSGGSGSAYVG